MSNFNLMVVPEKTLFWDYSVGTLDVSTKPCSSQSKGSFKNSLKNQTQKPSVSLIFFFLIERVLGEDIIFWRPPTRGLLGSKNSDPYPNRPANVLPISWLEPFSIAKQGPIPVQNRKMLTRDWLLFDMPHRNQAGKQRPDQQQHRSWVLYLKLTLISSFRLHQSWISVNVSSLVDRNKLVNPLGGVSS